MRSVTILSLSLLAFGCAPRLQPSPPARPEVVTTEGVVRGQTDAKGIESFLGVPYASPPVGPARWREAAPPLPRASPLDASAFRLPCSQIPIPAGSDSFGTGKRIPTSEDCLNLNLWVPPHAPGAHLPVMVWSHGGQYLRGAASQYDGDQLARLGQVVVVTLDYRLGPLGFLAHPAPDGGVPGDPDRITLFGESAGSATTCALIGSPLAVGLFHRTILQSDACLVAEDVPSLADREAFGRRMAKALGCEDAQPARELECMRSKTEDQVLTAIPLAKVMGDDGNGAKAARMPVMMGTTDNEMDRYVGGYGVTNAEQLRALIAKEFPRAAPEVLQMYAVKDGEDPFQQLAALFSDQSMTCPVRRDAVSFSTAGYPTYLYRFRHAPDVLERKAGAFHGSELAYLFPSVFRKLGLKYAEGDQHLAELMSGYWGRFAATGDPNGGGAMAWPRYEHATDRYLELDFAPSVGTGLRHTQCDLWDRFPDISG